MAHPNVENPTGFQLQTLFAYDETGATRFGQVIKGTFRLPDCMIEDKERQLPVEMVGKFNGDPNFSSYRYEPESAITKLTTDVVLIGHAYPTHRNQTQTDVRIRIADMDKTVRVVGDRKWESRFGVVYASEPQVIDKPIPLIYERAFGGRDAEPFDSMNGRFEPRNPVGVGFKRSEFKEGLPLPNLEDPRSPLKSYGENSPPAGFGFISPNWQPRVRFAGTYGETWQKERAPLLPSDFDPRFFNAASPGLIAKQFLKGDEQVLVENATPNGRLSFQLPGLQPPTIRIHLRGGETIKVRTNLDTVIVNTDEMILLLLWRNSVELRNGLQAVANIVIDSAHAAVQQRT